MDSKQTYFAHSGTEGDESDWQRLDDHLLAVGLVAGEFARVFGAQELAEVAGKLHDLGKYSARYQQRLRGGSSVDHATAGAKIAVEKWAANRLEVALAKILAFVIAGHHAGLANAVQKGDKRRTLEQRLDLQFGSDLEVLDDLWQEEIALPATLTAPSLKPGKKIAGFSMAMLTRMIYSCLVDADYLDTQHYYEKLEGNTVQLNEPPSLGALNDAFQSYMDGLRTQSTTYGSINTLRNHILDHAVAQSGLAAGLFTLTVPTGGGKTLTSMAFALRHALQQEMRRIIYVIPYTSIIEQNAAVFRRAFGALGTEAVLEHHSAFDDRSIKDEETRDKLRRASENWSIPVVVTTAVQFFESLFADRSSQCRKLHNIAGSVIILDEAQMIPLTLLRPIMAAIDELALNYRCSVVLCTATQPAIQQENDFYNGFEQVREIAPEPEKLFTELKRVTVHHVGEKDDTALHDILAQHEQMLLIVNNRRHARALYEAAADLDGVYHLTTLMCAAHRQQVLAEVRQRLCDGLPCRLVSTSLIECGVDVDFPFVMRAEAGLDSVAQAAGRCNREGKRSAEDSEVWVFAPVGWPTPPSIKFLAAIMRETLRHHDDALSTAAMTYYFQRIYAQMGNELDKHRLVELHTGSAKSLDFPFQDITKQFRMIDSYMLPLIVPFDGEAEKIIERLHYAEHIGGLMRRLQPYLVQIPEQALQTLCETGRVEFVQPQRFAQQFPVLIGLALYDDRAGLSWKNPDFISSFDLVL
ncbi:CRISPR-associated helicase Cas3' [Cardiobacteriaceae bacterium TAE3-ERU3]|nr:CRISPR-associated helicase Cas3' [Cardiobacteriaceae bacterium TAE3-ERU3]